MSDMTSLLKALENNAVQFWIHHSYFHNFSIISNYMFDILFCVIFIAGMYFSLDTGFLTNDFNHKNLGKL